MTYAHITATQVAEKAVELADANPEFVYQPQRDEMGYVHGCAYVHRDSLGNPNGEGCLFGQALVALGVSPYDIGEGVHVGKTMENLGIVEDGSVDHYALESEPKGLVQAMVKAQSEQDAREPWGLAITRVKSALRQQAVAA